MLPGEARRLFFFFGLGYLAVGLWLGGIQFLFRERLAADPHNPRIYGVDRGVIRGGILARGGEVITAGPIGKRRYLVPSLCHTVGYVSEVFGTSGLEAVYNEVLAGRDPRSVWANWLAAGAGRRKRGADVVTTIDLRLQEAASQALGPRRGAVVVVEATTGDILALVSRPGFHNPPTATDWKRDLHRADAPFLHRALSGLYPPGSTFKIVMAAAALEKGLGEREEFCAGELTVEGRRFKDADEGGHGRLDLKRALAVSCNIYFIRLAERLKAAEVLRRARAFGLGRRPPFLLPTKAGLLPAPMEAVETAAMAIGQGRLLVTPFQMALVAAAIVNDGLIMRPRLVMAVRFPDGERRYEARPWRRAISPLTAMVLKAALEKAVAEGTGRRAAVSGWRVGGKTGTAQVAEGAPHAWFVGFAQKGQRRLALAVIVEHGGRGGKVAAPIAAAVIRAAGGEGS